ncbi:MAG: TRAP transporter small permease subunit [Alphaproteobacteria bacterium]
MLRFVVGICEAVSAGIGRTVAWFALVMVLMQFTIVMMRYVFGIGFIFMQESLSYLHGFMYLLGAAYTLMVNGHVRVDIFYREASGRTKAWVDLCGTLLLLFPVCILVIWASWAQVIGSWDKLEGSTETSGIQAVFLLRTIIPLFAALMIVQGLAVIARSLLALAGFEDEGHGIAQEKAARAQAEAEP